MTFSTEREANHLRAMRWPATMRRIVLSTWLLVALGMGAHAAELVGWQRNSTASFPDAEVVTSFDGLAGKNILWKTPMPNWSNAGFILTGGKAYVLAEPWDGYSPYLLCIDATTGEELWRRELDAAATLPLEARQAAQDNARLAWRTQMAAEAVAAEFLAVVRRNPDRYPGGKPSDTAQPEVEAFSKKLAELGYKINKRSFYGAPHVHGSGGAIMPASNEAGKAQHERIKRMQADGLAWAAWRGSGTWCGVAYPTPCSDGRRVYVVTAQAAVFCFDLDGQPLWQTRILTPAWEDLTPAQRARIPKRNAESWSGGQLVQEYMTSPVLADVTGDGSDIVLLVQAGRMVRAIDTETGAVRWAVPRYARTWHVMGVPRVLRVDGEAVLVTAHGTPPGRKDPAEFGDELLRVRDGASVGRLPAGNSGKAWGTGAIVVEDDVIFCGIEPGGVVSHGGGYRPPKTVGALKLTWNAERTSLTHEILWQHPNRKQYFMEPAVADGVLYASDAALDLKTGGGLPIATHWSKVYQGYCDHGLIVTRNSLVRWNRFGQTDYKDRSTGPDKQAFFHFFDRRTGEPLGIGSLPISPDDGLSAERRGIEEHDRDWWRWLGAATPWAENGRLYIRAYDFLWCIGATLNQNTNNAGN